MASDRPRGLLFRIGHIDALEDVQTGLVCMTKIVTDPLHDVKLYYKAPLYLMRGELIDPMRHAQHGEKHDELLDDDLETERKPG